MRDNNGYNERTGLYKSRYYARKVSTGQEVVVKVDGGYKIMTYKDYQTWRLQR